MLAMALAGSSGDRPEFNRLDAASCARCLGRGVGEASHPGPTRLTATERASRREGLHLSQVALVEKRTENLETRLWEGFLDWLAEDCEAAKLNELLRASATLSPLIKVSHHSGLGSRGSGTTEPTLGPSAGKMDVGQYR